MKKLALASAIAAIATASVGAHAFPATGAVITAGFDITVPCSSTYNDGMPGSALEDMTYDADGIYGTVCMDPTGGGAPYVRLIVGMTNSTAGNASGTLMDGGYLFLDTDYGVGYAPYSVINVKITPIICQGMVPPITATPPGLACTVTLFGQSVDLYLN